MSKTKKMTTVAMLSALAYLFMVMLRIPVVLFLKYDPKDVVITLGGLIWGPWMAFAVSAVSSLLEMVTVSETGPLGCLMNILSTCAFACTAALIYRKKRNLRGAVLGLVFGVVIMSALMMVWNYLIAPIYMGYPREAVAAMLLPAFLPFNLLKGGLNAAVTFLLYKPVVGALRKSGLVPRPAAQGNGAPAKRRRLLPSLLAAAVAAACLLVILFLNGTL